MNLAIARWRPHAGYAPGTAVDLEAIQAVKTGLSTNIPYGYSLLYSSRQDSSFEKAGLVANAYVNEATGQILIAFRGPLSIPDGLVSSNTLERAALKVDLRIAFDDASVTTEMDREAQRLFSVVRDAAQGRGLSFTNQNVFVTGNSEGGFLAELLAKDENLSGETFGAPGIPGQQVNPAPNGNLINYLNKGDPVANLGSDALLAPFIAPAGTQYHYGKIQYIGSDTAGADLVKAAQVLFAPQDQFDIEAG
ncbi:MAG TPA: hypothetical protein VII39_13845, partial [Bradyrhizobium sp.]